MYLVMYSSLLHTYSFWFMTKYIQWLLLRLGEGKADELSDVQLTHTHTDLVHLNRHDTHQMGEEKVNIFNDVQLTLIHSQSLNSTQSTFHSLTCTQSVQGKGQCT